MKHSFVITLILLGLFLGAQVIGLFITSKYIDVEKSKVEGEVVWKDLPSVAGMKVQRPDVEPSVSVWYILGAILVGTVLILLIVRLQRALLWKIWFFLAVVLCLQIAFAAFIPSLIALILAVLLGWFKIFRPNFFLHNFTELFIYGGLAVIFVPILNVMYAFVLLIALSAYDMYAVWRSKHMIKMAKFQTKAGIFAGLLLPYKLPKIPKVPRKKPKQRVMRIRTAVLGGGDIGFPLILAGTVLKDLGMGYAFIISIASAAALGALLLLSKKKRFYPAMPFITIGCAIGYGIIRLLI